ncbi:MAG: hypothetical protein ACERKV_08235 [Clostridiaceae bacterium]
MICKNLKSKRNWLAVSLLIIGLVGMVGCGSNSKKSKKLIENYINKIYVIENYKDMDIEKINDLYPDDEYTKEIKAMMTDESFEEFVVIHPDLTLKQWAIDKHCNISIKDIKIEESFKKDDDTIVYNYTAVATLKFADSGEEKEENIMGQVSINKISGDMKIVKPNLVDLESFK